MQILLFRDKQIRLAKGCGRQCEQSIFLSVHHLCFNGKLGVVIALTLKPWLHKQIFACTCDFTSKKVAGCLHKGQL